MAYKDKHNMPLSRTAENHRCIYLHQSQGLGIVHADNSRSFYNLNLCFTYCDMPTCKKGLFQEKGAQSVLVSVLVYNENSQDTCN